MSRSSFDFSVVKLATFLRSRIINNRGEEICVFPTAWEIGPHENGVDLMYELTRLLGDLEAEIEKAKQEIDAIP